MHSRRLHQRHVRRFPHWSRTCSSPVTWSGSPDRPGSASRPRLAPSTLRRNTAPRSRTRTSPTRRPARPSGRPGIDALAVAISNAHGVYIAEPKLDFDLLAEIRRRTEVPLVLHGGSAIPVDQVQKAIGRRGQDERRNRNPRSVQGGYGGRLAENPGSHDIMESSAAASPASETSCASTSTSPCPPDALRDSGEPDAR